MDREFLSNFLFEKSKYISRAMLSDTTLELEKFYLFNTSFAITKAENSQLTESEALEIYDKRYREYNNDYFNEIRPHCEELLFELKVNKYNKKAKNQLIKYHDKLEFYNILKAAEFIRYGNANSDLYKKVLEQGITTELIQNLHFILTDGLDELFYEANIPDYSPYYSGEIRRTNNIRVGKSNVMDANSIPQSLNEINYLSRNIKNVFDIYEIHGKMYYTHIFHNGNKRVSRIIEELLMNVYGYTNGLPTTYGYYILDKNYIGTLVKDTLEEKNFSEWANFGYNASLLIVLDTMVNLIKKMLVLTISAKGLDEYIDILPMKFNFKRQDIEKLFPKKVRGGQEVKDMIEKLLNDSLGYNLIKITGKDNLGKEIYQYSFIDELAYEVYEQYVEVFNVIFKNGFSQIYHFPQYIMGEEVRPLQQ